MRYSGKAHCAFFAPSRKGRRCLWQAQPRSILCTGDKGLATGAKMASQPPCPEWPGARRSGLVCLPSQQRGGKEETEERGEGAFPCHFEWADRPERSRRSCSYPNFFETTSEEPGPKSRPAREPFSGRPPSFSGFLFRLPVTECNEHRPTSFASRQSTKRYLAATMPSCSYWSGLLRGTSPFKKPCSFRALRATAEKPHRSCGCQRLVRRTRQSAPHGKLGVMGTVALFGTYPTCVSFRTAGDG